MIKLSRWRAKIVTSLLLMTRVLGVVISKWTKTVWLYEYRFAEGSDKLADGAHRPVL